MKITIKKRMAKMIGMGALALVFFLGMFLGLLSSTPVVYGVNNTSVLVTLNITNTEPNIYQVDVNPFEVDLTPGDNTTVNCTAFVNDIDGYADIVTVNATLYRNDSGLKGAEDRNNRYMNQSCEACVQYAGDPNNASCTCLFSVDYYADNATWACNISVYDTENANASNRSYFSINPLLAIETPNSLDYGDVTVLETTSKMALNMTNFGNTPINISFRQHAGVDDTPANQVNAFTCGLNNISYDQHRWTIDASQDFNNMTPVSNATTPIGNLTLAQRTNDTGYGHDLNYTYYQLRVPLNVGGFCNGTMLFQAELAT